MTKRYGKYLLSSVMALLLAFTGYSFLEPDQTRAQSDDDVVIVSLTVDSGITITSPADATLTPNIGVSANNAIANTTWNVKTNDPDGYTLAVKAGGTPALQGAGGIGNFADFQASPIAWAVPSGQYQFGFSAYGTDVPTGTWGAAGTCGAAGVPNAGMNYRGFDGTNDIQIASRGATTTTSGIDSTVCWTAGQNGVYAAAGSYSATITATATVQ